MKHRLHRPLRFVALGASTTLCAFAGNQDEFWSAPNYLPSTLYRIDGTTGNATPIGIIPNIEPSDFALGADGTLYACTIDEFYRIDTTTAGSTFIATISTFSPLVGLDFAPNGQLYAAGYTGNVVSIDHLTGASGQVFSVPVNFSGDIAFTTSTTFYAAIESANGSNLARVDFAGPTVTDLGAIAAPNTFWGLDFDGAGNLIALTVSGDLYVIPNYATSGTGVFVASTNQGALAGLASADGGCPSIGAYCTAGFSSNFCQAMITAAGTPSASASSGFSISVFGADPQKQGILFYGINNTGFTPTTWGGGSSFLCVKSPSQRMGAQNTGGTVGLCDGTLGVDWNAYRVSHPGALGAPFSAGQSVFAQGWYRDPPSPKTTSLSNALRFTLCP